MPNGIARELELLYNIYLLHHQAIGPVPSCQVHTCNIFLHLCNNNQCVILIAFELLRFLNPNLIYALYGSLVSEGVLCFIGNY